MEHEPNPNNKPIVSTKVGNKLYLFNGEDNEGYSFTNLEDNKTGIVSKEQAQKWFNIPLELNEMFLKHQNLLLLFKGFNGSVLVEKNGVKKQYKV